jgi:hypothetical protein
MSFVKQQRRGEKSWNCLSAASFSTFHIEADCLQGYLRNLDFFCFVFFIKKKMKSQAGLRRHKALITIVKSKIYAK